MIGDTAIVDTYLGTSGAWSVKCFVIRDPCYDITLVGSAEVVVYDIIHPL